MQLNKPKPRPVPAFHSPFLNSTRKPSVTASSSGAPGPSSTGRVTEGSAAEGSVVNSAWSIQWRAQLNRKNKTWENDGFLVLKGTQATLKDEEGKVIGSGTITVPLAEGVEVRVGGKDVRLDEEIPYKIFQASVIRPPSSVQQPPSQPTRPPPATLSKPLPKPLPRHPSLPIPKRSALVPPPRGMGPGESRIKRSPSPKKENHPPLQARPSSASSNREEEEEEEKRGHEKVEASEAEEEEGMEEEEEEPTPAQASIPPRRKKRTSDNIESTPPPSSPTSTSPIVSASNSNSHSKSKRARPSPTPSIGSPSSSSRSASSSPPRPKSITTSKAKEKEKSIDQYEDMEIDELAEVGEEMPIVTGGPRKKFVPPWASLESGMRADKSSKGKGKQRVVSEDEDDEEEEEQEEKQVVKGTHYYLVQWRKPSQKKQPVWEGDGVLIITDGHATLKDREDGKALATGTCKGHRRKQADFVYLGSKIMQVESVLDEADYVSGKCFYSCPPPATVQASQVKASLFYIPTVVQPKGFRPPGIANFLNVPNSRSVDNVKKPPHPRFDPTAEDAIVMLRPSIANEERYNKKKLPIVDVVVDPVIGKKLRPHQIDGVKFMYECVMGMKTDDGRGCILADEMGLGKTIQAIALIWTLLKQNPFYGVGGVIQRAMIVCPVTLVKNWAAEIKKWLGKDRISYLACDGKTNVKTFCISKSYQVLIIGYEKYRTVVEDLKYCQPPIGLVICDEGHRLKSNETLANKSLRELSTTRRIILTGTPIQNDLKEFHSLIDFVNPGILDTYQTFKKTYEVPIIKSREPNCSVKDKKLGEGRASELSTIAHSFMIRRDGTEYTVFVLPTQLEIDIYSRVLGGAAVKDVLVGDGATQQLSLLMMLRNICNSPGLLIKSHNSKVQKEENVSSVLTSEIMEMIPDGTDPDSFELSGKLLVLRALLGILRKHREEKIVVVSNFTSVLDIIEHHCRKEKYPFCRLDGATNQNDRISIVDDFNRGPIKTNFIFLLSSKSGGTGLNIIGASRLVLFDSDWNPSNDAQVMARIHRQGQTKECVIYRFLTTGTIDEKIYQRQITKLGLSGSLMARHSPATDPTAAATGKKGSNAFTRDDLRNIFRLHTDCACQTHELLECQCGETDGNTAAETEESDDEELPTPSQIWDSGFKQASQWVAEDQDKIKKGRRDLSLLKEWTHHNVLFEASAGGITDNVLKEVIFKRATESVDDDNIGTLPGSMPLKGGRVSFAFSKSSGTQFTDGGDTDDANGTGI